MLSQTDRPGWDRAYRAHRQRLPLPRGHRRLASSDAGNAAATNAVWQSLPLQRRHHATLHIVGAKWVVYQYSWFTSVHPVLLEIEVDPLPGPDPDPAGASEETTRQRDDGPEDQEHRKGGDGNLTISISAAGITVYIG